MIIRPATAADAPDVADIDLAARAEALPSVRWAHPPAEVRHWIATVLIPGRGVFVAEAEGKLLGYMALHDDFVGQLYLRPGHWRKGIGTQLLNHAKSLLPGGFFLWCFQINARARAFYESQGLVIEKMTDGGDNEEREPDGAVRVAAVREGRKEGPPAAKGRSPL